MRKVFSSQKSASILAVVCKQFFRRKDKAIFCRIPNPIANSGLEEKGVKIYLASDNFRLHDKLIIVDDRYVVEGSVNCTVSAIKDNFESAVIIESPELAKIFFKEYGVDCEAGKRKECINQQ